MICVNLSINIFRPVFPMEMERRLTTFLFACISSRFPISAACLGFCWSASRRISVREMECLANTATSKSCLHYSQSKLGGLSASCQKYVTPGSGEFELFSSARSAMLKTCVSTAFRVRNGIRVQTVFLNYILSYGNGANFATLDVFGRLLLNTYFQTIVFLQYCVNMRLASTTVPF